MQSWRHFSSRLAALVAVLALALVAATPPAGAAAQAKPVAVPILLDWTPNTDHSGLYAAVAQGYFRQAGITAQIAVPSDATDALEEVAAGRVDFAVSYEPDVLLARAQGIPVLSVMALVDRPLNTIMSLASSHITSAADLRGKRIGIAGVPSDHAVVSAVLQYAHIPASDVQLVDVGYNLLPALLHHDVDAVEGVYWTWEAVELREQGYKVNVLHLESVGVPTYDELVLVTSDHLAETDPALVARTVQAIQRGYAFAYEHPVAAGTDLLKETTGLSPRLVRASLKLLAPAFDYRVPTVGYQSIPQWRVYLAWMRTHHLIKGTVVLSDAVTNRFLKSHVGA
jgi:ABC-type nitrate/sulfonate/bicarbonate transport system substrate-binding protein